MTRGNQRELARAKNAKKSQDLHRKKGADQKDGNKGLSLENRKHRDAEVMREKQRKAAEGKGDEGKGDEGKGDEATAGTSKQ
ncbi:Modifier of protein aggregation 4 [Chamberlinius hualienensis]